MNQLLAMRAFVRLVETSSFSRTSDQLSIPRSTVSKLIHDLEMHLNARLILRSTRKLSVTAEGQEYYRFAVRLIADVDVADGLIQGEQQRPAGHLRIDVPALFAETVLIPAIPEFYRQYPEISLAVGISDRVVNIIEEGVDCVIRGGKLNELGMVARHLASLDYVTCAAPAYLQRRGIPVHPTNLADQHDLVGYFSAATGKTEPLTFNQGSEQFVFENRMFSANGGNGIIQMMVAGLGIGQPIREYVSRYLETGELVEILPEWHRSTLQLHVMYPPNRYQNPRLKVFIIWLLEYVKSLNLSAGTER